METKKKKIIVGLACGCIVGLTAIALLLLRPEPPKKFRTWNEIAENQLLKVGILYNSTDYYILNGTIHGFHYEMVEDMAKHFNLQVEYKSYASYWEYFNALLKNEVDMLAMDLYFCGEESFLFDQTLPHSHTHLVLAQNKKNKILISDTLSAAYKDSLVALVVSMQTAYKHAGIRFQQKHTNIIPVISSGFSPENLLFETNTGNIDLTIADYKIINASRFFYDNIDYSTSLSDELPLFWAIKKGNKTLLDSVNAWMGMFLKTKIYPQLLESCYNPTSSIRSSLKRELQTLPFGVISRYDNLMKKHGQTYNFDWLLLASLIYQESRFHANVVGPGGSFGLMQLMPNTAKRFGVTQSDSPDKQINAGCMYLSLLRKKYMEAGITDSLEAMKFTLAAYNAGKCHIDDARTIAKLKGLSDTLWDDHVEKALLLLLHKEYYAKAGINCGKTKSGNRTSRYVKDIIRRYNNYKNIEQTQK